MSTPPGEGGVAVVRVSGTRSLAVADRVFRSAGEPPSARPSHTVTHGRIVATDGTALDEALLLVFRAPRSFTGEDVAEFHCHGGCMTPARILRRLIEAGCRPAEPGEFSRRAFLNGRIDLTQAEAILDLIRARSDRAAAVAVHQLEGGLRKSVDGIYDRAMDATSGIEASLDFPEEESTGIPIPGIVQTIRACIDACRSLAASWADGRILRDGIHVVIAGRPNVGKSSVFNLLVGTDRAITSSTPGTTRDTIDEWLVWSGYGVRLTDTAGLRVTECPIEKDGVRRSFKQLSEADLWLYVIESNQPPHKEDLDFMDRREAERMILVFNKIDLGVSDSVSDLAKSQNSAFVCSLQSSYRKELIDICSKFFSDSIGVGRNDCSVSVSERHRLLLDAASSDFTSALDILEESREDSCLRAATHMRSGLESLGQITGRSYSDEMLDRIFSKFCIGK